MNTLSITTGVLVFLSLLFLVNGVTAMVYTKRNNPSIIWNQLVLQLSGFALFFLLIYSIILTLVYVDYKKSHKLPPKQYELVQEPLYKIKK